MAQHDDDESYDGAVAELPPLYARWLADALPGAIPAETEATCDDCAMCPSGGGDARADEGAFDPTTKCCTYLPAVPNFLVGAALADTARDPITEAGRASVRARIAARVAVTPLGLEQTPLFEALYRHGGAHGFGRARALRCPHYVLESGGRCGIWRHREATCATWFCKHARGAVGQLFWRDALKPLLAAVERGLARHCVLELGIDATVILPLLTRAAPSAAARARRAIVDAQDSLEAGDLDGVPDPARHAALWGRWAGREEEFYRSSHALIAPLRWRDVAGVCGPEVRLLERAARHAYGALRDPHVPESLRLGVFAIAGPGEAPGYVRIRTYSDLDPVDLPHEVLAALRAFDGRATREAVRAVVEQHGVEFDEALLRQLVDFGVLEDAAAAAVSGAERR